MNLKQARKSKGLTQVAVALKIGCSLTSYRLWEAGVTKPSEEYKGKLEEVLGAISCQTE